MSGSESSGQSEITDTPLPRSVATSLQLTFVDLRLTPAPPSPGLSIKG